MKQYHEQGPVGEAKANYLHVITQKGFVIVDKDSIDEATKTRLEGLGYVVIEKQTGRTVEVVYLQPPITYSFPFQPLYPQPYTNPQPYYNLQTGGQGASLNG